MKEGIMDEKDRYSILDKYLREDDPQVRERAEAWRV